MPGSERATIKAGEPAHIATEEGPGEPLWLAKPADHRLTGDRLNRSGLRWLLDRLGQKAGVENCLSFRGR